MGVQLNLSGNYPKVGRMFRIDGSSSFQLPQKGERICLEYFSAKLLLCFSYLPPELYADVFAMGLVDLFGTASYGATVIILGVGEVDEQREW